MKKKSILTLLTCAISLLFFSCNSDELVDSRTIPQGDRTKVVLRIKTPSSFNPASRSLSVADESKIENIYVLGFKVNGTALEWEYVSEGTVTSTSGNITTFRADIEPSINSQQYRLVIIANAKAEIESLFGHDLQSYTGGNDKSYQKVQELLSRTISSKMFPASSQDKIPMWGATDAIRVTSDINSTINMVRSIARVDIGLGRASETQGADYPWSWDGKNAANEEIPFKISTIHVVRANKGISVMPALGNLTGDVANNPTLVPSDTKFEVNEHNLFEYTDIGGNGLYSTQSIYIPEANVVTPGGTGDSHLNRVAVVVGGYYNGSTTLSYYRINFMSGPDLKNILRNHLYRISIISVIGAGSDSVTEAYESRAMNMETEVLEWNDSEIDNVEFDGVNYFGIEKREVIFNPMGGEEVIYSVRTNVANWTMSTTDGTKVLDAATTQRTYTNADGSFKYTIASTGANLYTLTVESLKHNVRLPVVRREEELKITASRLTLDFKTTQESTDLYIDIKDNYRFYPEGSTPTNQITINVVSLTAVSVSNNGNSWLDITSNTVLQGGDGIHQGTITVALPSWLQTDGTNNRTGQISITPTGRPTRSATVTQEAPYLQFSETTVMVRALVTRAADYVKTLQVRTNLPVGSVNLSVDRTADPTNIFSVVGGESSAAFSYPDSYYPRYASMTVEAAALNSLSLNMSASVTYIATGSTAFTWLSSSSTFIIQPSSTIYRWQWDWAGWNAGDWDPGVVYYIPWHWNAINMKVESNRGVSTSYNGSITDVVVSNPTIGAAGTSLYSLAINLESKPNATTTENFSITLKDDGSVATSPVNRVVNFRRANQVFTHNRGSGQYTFPWKGGIAEEFILNSNVNFSVSMTELDYINISIGGTTVGKDFNYDARNYTPQTNDPNGTSSLSINFEVKNANGKLNSGSVSTDGAITFTNLSNMAGSPTQTAMLVKQYTPQLRRVSHNIPNPIPAAGGIYTVRVSTNIADARAAIELPGNSTHLGNTSPVVVDETAGAMAYDLTISVPANTGAQRNIQFYVCTNLNGMSKIDPLMIAQEAPIEYVTITYHGNDPLSGNHRVTGNTLAQNVVKGTPTQLRPNGFSRNLYYFNGWSTTPTTDISGSIADGADFSSTSNVNLYATWHPTDRTVNFLGDDGRLIRSDSYITPGGAINYPNNLYSDPYVTNEWWSGSKGSGIRRDGTSYTMPDEASIDIHHYRRAMQLTYPNTTYIDNTGRVYFILKTSEGSDRSSGFEALAYCNTSTVVNSVGNGRGWYLPSRSLLTGGNLHSWYSPMWALDDGNFYYYDNNTWYLQNHGGVARANAVCVRVMHAY